MKCILMTTTTGQAYCGKGSVENPCPLYTIFWFLKYFNGVNVKCKYEDHFLLSFTTKGTAASIAFQRGGGGILFHCL